MNVWQKLIPTKSPSRGCSPVLDCVFILIIAFHLANNQFESSFIETDCLIYVKNESKLRGCLGVHMKSLLQVSSVAK